MSDDVIVIQTDRAAAVEMLRGMWRLEHGNVAYGWMRDEEGATLSGKRDDLWAVQAFAKHRLSTPSPDSGERMREGMVAVPENMLDELRKLYRGLEMFAGIMRDPARTGRWAGAEKTAAAFARYAATAQSLHALMAASAALQESAR